MPATCLRVALPLPRPVLFDYLPPAGVTAGADWLGCRVRVPFGRGEKIGVVAALGAPEVEPAALKPIVARLDWGAALFAGIADLSRLPG